MDDKTPEVTPEVEETKVEETKVEVKEGTVEAEISKITPEVESKKEAETVPLAVYLSLKDDVKELKREIKEASANKKDSTTSVGIRELAEKYPEVDKQLMEDLINSATARAQEKIDETYKPVIARQEAEKKQIAFDKAFDNLFDKTMQDMPDLPKTVDKDMIKTIALTPQYRNIPLSEILLKIYGGQTEGRSSSESETRASADKVGDMVTFDKITPSQKQAIMADDKVRAKYFDWLDKQ